MKPYGAAVCLRDSRIIVTGYADEDACLKSVCRVFGVHSVCAAIRMPKDDFTAVCGVASSMMKGLKGTFKVRARRSDKTYPIDSPAISAMAGACILSACPGLSVDVHHPLHTMNIEIRETALLYVRVVRAAGGLPSGSGGKAMLLLSGGIDSPVAGFRIARRGVEISAVHFHSFPYTGEAAKQKVKTLAEILASYTFGLRLYIVSFTEIQEAIHQLCPEEYSTLLMRRCMMRIAELIARKEKAQALITGESIGQVASQTMEALVCTDAVVEMPVFRPLIGTDKLEIIREASDIGTYEVSCLPYEDCCTVFTPRHPVTHPRLDKTEKAEFPLLGGNQLDDMITRAIGSVELFEYR